MFDTICDLIPRDSDYPARTRALEVLRRVLDGRLYETLPFHFHEERGPGGEYIPLRQRRPSVRYPLCRIVVEDSVSLLFGEGHFPSIDCPSVQARTHLANIARESRLNLLMIEAAVRGAVGSVAILMRVLKGRLFFDVLDSLYLTPVWASEEPDTLASVTERYKVAGATLIESGFAIDDPAATYWFTRRWDRQSEVWYIPTRVGESGTLVEDQARTIHHRLGFVPLVWIRNLPGLSSSGSPSEGECTFRAAIQTQIEIDYQLSQVGRGLKYSSDPTLLLKDPAANEGDLIKGAGNALVVGEKGDARLLEIGGTAATAVIEYVRTLRELALESIHGNRASPERLTAAQSGRALELLNQGLIWLADNLRITYGEVALLQLVGMIVRASEIYPLRVMGDQIGPLQPDGPLSLRWPRWYPLSADDRQKDAQTLAALRSAGHLSQESAVKSICDTYDIVDPSDELDRIQKDAEIKDDHD